MNKVLLIGSIVDKKIKQVARGIKPFIEVNLKVKESYYKLNEWKSSTKVIKIIAWGDIATNLNKYDTGEQLSIEGVLSTNNTRNTIDVICKQFKVIK